MKAPRLCHKCDKPVSSQSKTGYCRSCFARMNGSDRYSHAKSTATIKRRLLSDPEFAQAHRERAKRNANTPAALAYKRTVCADRMRDPEVRKKALARARATRRSHVPAHLWEDYWKLCRRGFKKAEALEIVLGQFRRDDPQAAAEWDAKQRVVTELPTRFSGWRKTIADVAEAFGLTFADVATGGNRFNPRPDARAVCAMLFLDKGWSTTMVAGRIGLTDHTTVVHYRKTWSKRCKKRPIVGEVYARFCAERLAA